MSQFSDYNFFLPSQQSSSAATTTDQQQLPTRGIRAIVKCPDVLEVLVQVLSHLDPLVDQYLFNKQDGEQGSELNINQRQRSDFDVAFEKVCKSVWSLEASDWREPIDGSGLGGLFPSDNVSSLDFGEALNLVVDGCSGSFDFCKGMTSNWIKSENCPMCGCQTSKERKEEFCSLKVPQNQWKEFEKSGILNLQEIEKVDGYSCGMCTFRLPVEMSRTISQTPQILVLQMDRFYFDYETFSTVKRNDFFKVYLNQQLKLMLENNSLQYYELIAVVDHYGLQASGAYGGYFLNPTNNRWYKVSCSGKVPSQVADLSSINNGSNYIYFFRRVAEKKLTWQTTALSSQSVSDISFSFTNEDSDMSEM